MPSLSVLPLLLAADAAAAEPEASSLLPLLAAVAVIVGSFVAGHLLAKAVKMPDYGLKIGVIVLALAAGLTIVLTGQVKLGIDLRGGVILNYQVDRAKLKSRSVESIARSAGEFLASDKGESLTVRSTAAGLVEVVLPPKGDAAAAQARVQALEGRGVKLSLQSRGEVDGKTVLSYQPDLLETVNMEDMVSSISRRINPGGQKEVTVRKFGTDQVEIIIPDADEREIALIKKTISSSGLLEFRILADPNIGEHRAAIDLAQATSAREVRRGKKVVGRWVKVVEQHKSAASGGIVRKAAGGGEEVFMLMDELNVDGSYLVNAARGRDESGLIVTFAFNSQGAALFRELTSNNLSPNPALRRRLGIVLDDGLLSAPTINSVISDRGQISGNFTEDDVKFLVEILNAGRLPAALVPEPTREQDISALLGQDTIKSGANSIVISTAAILIFMLVYYRFSGMLANLAVVLNVLITVALMIVVQAAFTLPGLAGIVLTVGMAVDANVLIYERMREELGRGASVRMAIRNGFSRATATIVDSNVTTILTALVLYAIGTDQVKGFAVTLILGLVISMFTAIFVSRVLFDVCERRGLITQLKMMKLFGATHYDFVKYLRPCLAVSGLIILAGLVTARSLGKNLFDIDFTGGTTVNVVFRQQTSIEGVRGKLAAVAELPDVAVSGVGSEGREYKIDTSQTDLAAVRRKLVEVFSTAALQTYSMDFAPPRAAEEEKKVDAEKAESKPAETKPAETKPTESKPAESKPAETQPAETKPAETKTEEKGDPKKAAETTADERPAPPATDEKPAEEKAGPTQPTEDKKPQTTNSPAAPPNDQAASDGRAAPAPIGRWQSAVVATLLAQAGAAGDASTPAEGPGSQAELTFGDPALRTQGINESTLREFVQSELTKATLPAVAFSVRSPEPGYVSGASKPFNKWTLQIQLPPDQTATLLAALKQGVAQTPVFTASSQVGGKVAQDAVEKAFLALFLSFGMIVIYVWIRFQNALFGVAAVVALVHDVLVTVGFLAFSHYLAGTLGFLMVDPFKISLAVVAALLTIIGFSINDTIVIFDRLREVRGKNPTLSSEMINVSVNQTLSRTILTSGTVLLASVILYFMGGQGIHAFAFAMVVGAITGTYSSVYIAAPLLLLIGRHRPSPTTAPSLLTGSRAGA